MKLCPGCNVVKSLDEFHSNKSRMGPSNNGKQTECKECFKGRYSLKSKEERRRNHIKRYYGLEWEKYLNLYASQNGNCAICDTPIGIMGTKTNRMDGCQVDHCHSTGKVRGLLCQPCNTGIAGLKESIEILNNAIKYLEGKK